MAQAITGRLARARCNSYGSPPTVLRGHAHAVVAVGRQAGARRLELLGVALERRAVLQRRPQRERVDELIKEYGGKATGSVSGKTDFLVAGDELEDGPTLVDLLRLLDLLLEVVFLALAISISLPISLSLSLSFLDFPFFCLIRLSITQCGVALCLDWNYILRSSLLSSLHLSHLKQIHVSTPSFTYWWLPHKHTQI